jgi:hypothetical protein
MFPIKSSLLLTFCVVIFSIINSSAQFGIRLKYNSNNYKNWESAINQRYNTKNTLLPSGYEIGLDYWFRLEKRRIEFMPELYFSQSATTYTGTEILDKINVTGVGFNFHTQIYALDFEGDCNCPTFSKSGTSIDKGLFFHFTPGLLYHTTSATFDPVASMTVDPFKKLIFRAGVGVGIDIGLSDLLTITPMLSYYFSTAMNWDTYLQSSTNLSQLQFTLRLGFRPDYGRKRRR